MNNKGFAITTILYGTLILFLMLLLSMLKILSTYSDRLEMLVENNNGARFNINYENIAYLSSNNTAGTSEYIEWKLENAVLSVKNIRSTSDNNGNDGYGFVPYKVELIAGETYYFGCDTDAKWTFDESDGVEAWLMLDGKYETYYHMEGKNNYSFTPTKSGVYWLRLDVNKTGMTHKFSNIKVLGKKRV